MANFYISPVGQSDDPAGSILYELHATTTVTATFSSSVTQYPIESGGFASDNVVMDPIIVKFSGILTDVKQSGVGILGILRDFISGPDLTGSGGKVQKAFPMQKWIDNLRVAQKNKQVFLVYFSGDTDDPLNQLSHAILTSLNIKKDTSIGTSWRVDLIMQEVRQARRAQVVDSPAEVWTDLLEAKKTANESTASADEFQTTKIIKGAFTKADETKADFELGFKRPVF